MSELLHAVQGWVGEHPEAPALIAVGEVETVWSWGDLWQESARVAALLVELGVRPGDAVAYQLPNCARFVTISLGVLRAGAVCCPLMPMFREREIAYALERSRARVLFARESYHGRRPLEEAAVAARQAGTLTHLIAVGTAEALPRVEGLTVCRLDERLAVAPDMQVLQSCAPGARDFAQLLFTSGTSGTPKGVLHRHDTLTLAVRLASRQLGLSRADRLYMPSPLAHQTGFLYGMWLALTLGATGILQETWEPVRGLRALREHRATFVQAATPFLMDLTQAVEAGETPPERLRIFVATGTAVPRAVARRAAGVLRTSVCGAFGTTEGCLATLSSPSDPPDKARGSDGRALPSIDIRVCDESGASLPPDAEGELQVRSPTSFQGYLDDARATEAAFTPDGWYRTGDLARIDPDGFLHITGRIKDVINRGGEKIPVAELEQLLYRHEAVREVAIVAMPDERLGERACAFVVMRPSRRLDFKGLCAFLDECKVAKPYWPERLEIAAELPKTPSGKIQKYLLRERARSLSPQTGAWR